MKIKPFLAVMMISLMSLSACDFLGGIFKTGVGIGALAVIVLLVLVFFLVRIFKDRP